MDAWTKGNVRRTLGKTEKNSMLVICKLSNRTELSSLYLRSSQNGRQICHPRYFIQWHFLLRCTVGNILWKGYIFSWMGAAPVNIPRPKKLFLARHFLTVYSTSGDLSWNDTNTPMFCLISAFYFVTNLFLRVEICQPVPRAGDTRDKLECGIEHIGIRSVGMTILFLYFRENLIRY